MSDYIKKMSDERLREKLDYWQERQWYLERRNVNITFSHDYKKAVNNYMRYLREWSKRQTY